MEETVEAAATVINYLGASILEAKCEELVARARGADEAAHVADFDSANLNRAARQLEEAGGEGRLLAVVNLRDASAALEGAARARLHALRRGAANLARSCGDYRDTANAIDKILRTKEAEEEELAGRPAATWWSSIWRIRGRQQGVRQNLLDDVEQPKEPLNEVDVRVTLDLLSQEMLRPLEERGKELVAGARHVITAAVGVYVPHGALLVATDALERAGDPAARLNCAIDLGTAASAMEAADSAPLKAVCDRAAELARACLELKRAAEAMVRVQRAAAELRERRVAGAWWSCVWRRRRRRGEQRVEVLEDGAAAAAVQPGLAQGEDRRSDMIGLALCGSLTLITYLGPETVAERVKILPCCYRLCFHAAFSLWWTLQAAGVPFSAYARSLLELRCAQIICRLGMLGVNGLTVVFVYLALGIHNRPWLYFLLAAASVVHLGSFLLALCRGDLSK